MRIEKETISLKPYTLSPSAQGGMVRFQESGKSYSLSTLQFSYLEVLPRAQTLEGFVQFFLGQGWLVQFRELHSLIEFLVTEGAITNASFREYFKINTGSSFATTGPQAHTKAKDLDAGKLPFFRSLEPEVARYLLQEAHLIEVPSQTRITTTGDHGRDLYILLKGQAGIYKVQGPHQRKMLAVLEAGSLFGERGFLLRQPRTADVITIKPSQLLCVPHRPEFDTFIKSDKAQSLQHRFWVLQALAASDIFKDLPGDSLDALIFSGRLVQAHAQQVLFHEGQPGNTCYVLVQGNVVASQQGQTIRVMSQGACFGEISLMASGGVRTATITTQQASVLLEIQQKDFYRVLSQNLTLAKEIETLAATRLQNDAQRSRR